MSEIRHHLLVLAALVAGVAACAGEQSSSEPISEDAPVPFTQESAPPPAPVPPPAGTQALDKVDTVAVAVGPGPGVEVSPTLTLVYTNNIDGEIEPCG
jgi:hypothetical protein